MKNFSVLDDRKLHVNSLMSVKALLCFVQSLGDVTVSSLCLADSSLKLKMFCPGFAMMLFERAHLLQIVWILAGRLFTF